MFLGNYVLDGKEPRPCDDVLAWGRWMEDADRDVRKTVIELDGRRLHVGVSTVFLGMDHNFFGDGPPLLFETLVFGGPLDDHMERTSTWEDAERAHDATVRLVIAALQAEYQGTIDVYNARLLTANNEDAP